MVTRKRKSDLIDDEDDDAESDHEDADADEAEQESEMNNTNHRYSNTAPKGHIKNQESVVSFMGDKFKAPQRKC